VIKYISVMQDTIKKVEQSYMKKNITDVRSGDTVKVTQKIKEGSKERTQDFEGLVIRTRRMGSHTATIAVRKIASGVGVEKTFLLHSPLVTKVEVTKRSKVRRNYLSYMRERTGKSSRLANVGFDSDSVNAGEDIEEAVEEPKEEKTEKTEKTEDSPKEEIKPEDVKAKEGKE